MPGVVTLRRGRGPSAQVVRVNLENPLEPVAAGHGHDQLYVIARVGRTVVGHAWIPAPHVSAETLTQTLSSSVGGYAGTAALRAAVRRHLELGMDRESGSGSVSVIVCSRDRPGALRDCLESLLALDPPAQEILVVDNASATNEIRELCEVLPVRYLHEPVPGLSRARNRGIAESRGRFVAFTDDDCIVEPNWLAGLDRLFMDPLVQTVTGYIGPWELSTAAQVHFERHGGFKRHYAPRWFEAVGSSPVRGATMAGAGANMMFRRTVFDEIGPFAEELGAGTPARGADDKDAFYRVLAAGYRIAYDPGCVVWHQHRRDNLALRRTMNDYGLGDIAWSTRLVVRYRELAALRLMRWWLRHFAADVYRWLRRHPYAVPLVLTAEEVRGAVRGPGAVRASERSRRGVPPVYLPRALGDAAAAPAVSVTGGLPHLSVAVASHNRRESLRDTLRALAAQDYAPDRWEIVLVLDGSTDESAQMARSFELPCELRIIEQPTRGVAAARNRGAASARHPIVVFLDDDIRPVPGFLKAHAAAHRDAAGDHLALGYYPPAFEGRDLNSIVVRAWWTDHFRRLAEPAHRWRFTDVCDGNSSIPVRLFDTIGRFDEDFSAGRRRQDWEFGVRVLNGGVPLQFHPAAKAWHHFDPRLATTLRNARQEGRDDVLLATKHPEATASLPLADLADGQLERLLIAGGAIPRLASLRVWEWAARGGLNALETAHLRGRWRRLLSRVYTVSYASGVLDALPSATDRAELLDSSRWPRQELVIDLEAPAEPLAPDGVVMPRLCVEHRGRRVTAVDAVKPGGQWDPEALVDRLSTAVAAQGWLPWLMPLVSEEGSSRPVPAQQAE